MYGPVAAGESEHSGGSTRSLHAGDVLKMALLAGADGKAGMASLTGRKPRVRDTPQICIAWRRRLGMAHQRAEQNSIRFVGGQLIMRSFTMRGGNVRSRISSAAEDVYTDGRRIRDVVEAEGLQEAGGHQWPA